jgi:UDP-glucose 6-dehydrogenase
MPIHKTQLANGLQVILQESHIAPVASFFVFYRVGSRNHEAAEKVAQLHLPLRTRIVMTDLRTAEMIKYASNAFLATNISLITESASIC